MSSEGKRQRKAYLHSDEPFEVPYATKHRRSTRSCGDDKAQPACSRASEPAAPSGSQGSCEAVHVDREEAEAIVDTSSDCDTQKYFVKTKMKQMTSSNHLQRKAKLKAKLPPQMKSTMVNPSPILARTRRMMRPDCLRTALSSSETRRCQIRQQERLKLF